VAAAITAVTMLNRVGVIPLHDVASSLPSAQEGRIWLLLTSAFVADRPAVPSIVGFVVVGVAALAFCGSRVLWTSALAGHLLGTVLVYVVLDAANVRVTIPDFGTSAMIAAWIGVIAYHVRTRGHGVAPLALCIVAGLTGWLFRPDLDILDTEHVVALALGVGVAAGLPKMPPLGLAARLARRRAVLQTGLLRHGGG
jgi:hypothetical protein